MRRWFHVSPLKCKICDDKVALVDVLMHKATMLKHGKFECVRCTRGSKKLKAIARFYGLTL